MSRDLGGDSLRLLRSLSTDGVASGLSDGELLGRFARRRDEAGELAFAALVERHGPMVLRACRGVLRDEHDATDAFQATFLVLARKSGSLWVRDSLGPWLHRVACRAARRLKGEAARRQTLHRQLAERLLTRRPEWNGGGPAADLHEEIDRLPERFRLPLVLCDLEGHTYEEASRTLGWSAGTVKSRLAEARRRLRFRLTRGGAASAALPPGLARVTGLAAARFAAGQGSAGAVSAGVVKLTEGVLKSMSLATLARCTAALALVAFAGLGAAGFLARLRASEPPKVEAKDDRNALPRAAAAGPAALVARYEEGLAAYGRVKGRWVVTVNGPLEGEGERREDATEEWTVRRDGGRARLVQTKGFGDAPSVYETLRMGTQWVSVYPNGVVMSRLQSSDPEDWKQLGVAICSPIYGIIDQKSIPAWLRNAKVVVRSDTLDGHAVSVVRGVTDDVDIELWLDPALGYAARRIRFEKRVVDVDPTVRTRQFDATRFLEKDGRYVVAEAVDTFTIGPQPVFQPILLEKEVNGKRVQTHPPARDEQGNVVMTPRTRYVWKVTLREIDFNPRWTDRDFQFSRPIADGTRVVMQDDRESDYEWRNGRIVLNASAPRPKRPSKPPEPGPGAVDAEEQLKQARALARSENKKVFVHVGAPSCGWCGVLEDFLDANRRLFDDQYVVVKVDIETMRKGSDVADLLRQGAYEGGGIPWIAVLDADGKALATSDRPNGNIGCPVLPGEIDYFLAMLKRTSTMTEPRLAEIRDAIDKHMKPYRDRLPAAFREP